MVLCGMKVYRQSRWQRLANRYPNITGDVIISEIDPNFLYVPASCCVKYNDPDWFYHTMYGQFRGINRCQTWKLGPPSQAKGGYNDAIYYNVLLSSYFPLSLSRSFKLLNKQLCQGFTFN